MKLGSLPFWPQDASVTGQRVDTITISELALVIVILLAVFGMMIAFVVRYRRGGKVRRSRPPKTWIWEIGWTGATLVAFLGLFAWGAEAYLYLYRPPRADLEIFIVGKQWMWKVEHPGGQREIDALHVPLGKTVRLVLASQDVIHSFYVPAFRVKRDVVPGTYEVMWFKPTRLGRFRIECTQYCGTDHSRMTGAVEVMRAADYASWLDRQGTHESMAQQGEALFRRHGCSGCHTPGSTVHAPSLAGLYGSLVHLQSGETVRADDQYIRDCILFPHRHVPAGYPPIMPSFEGQLGEDELLKLVAYIQSLAPNPESQP
jgi:cytochrome c oxidase subunit 2